MEDCDESSQEAIQSEVKHFETVVKSFLNYETHANVIITKAETSYSRLPIPHQTLLNHLPQKFLRQRECVKENQSFLHRILEQAPSFSENSFLLQSARTSFKPSEVFSESGMDMDKVRCTLRQFVRDWADEGSLERKECYEPILQALEQHFQTVRQLGPEQRAAVRVLVPGAGLGRLPYEVARRGFSAQGCEFSYQMLLSSSYVLNFPAPAQDCLYPWVLTGSNLWQAAEAFRQVRVPDHVPGGLGPDVELSMVAGDFVELYSGAESRGRFGAVVTCFFLDTASNVVRYAEIIRGVLSPGGVWINLGPLLYHYTDSPDVDSTELSWLELRALLPKLGLELREEAQRDCHYTQATSSMLETIYHAVFFVAVPVHLPTTET